MCSREPCDPLMNTPLCVFRLFSFSVLQDSIQLNLSPYYAILANASSINISLNKI